jgi:DNA topoisomerase I
LDEIADGKKEWVPVIRDFYTPFEKILKVKDKELKKHDITMLEKLDEKCPECGSQLEIKLGKFGKFKSCSNYPKCSYAAPMEEDKVLDENGNEITDFGKCPNCEDGHFVLRTGRFGKFLACSNYPKCKTAQPFLEKIGMKCPKCTDGDIIVRKYRGRIFYGCSNYPKCDYSSWKDPRLANGAGGIEGDDAVSAEELAAAVGAKGKRGRKKSNGSVVESTTTASVPKKSKASSINEMVEKVTTIAMD